MKRIILSLFVGLATFAAPVPHAILTPDLQRIERYENIDPGLVEQYRADELALDPH